MKSSKEKIRERNQIEEFANTLKPVTENLNRSTIIVVEGATCSGKTSLVKNLSIELQNTFSINTRIIPEAARIVLSSKRNISSELQSIPQGTEEWKMVKKNLQFLILKKQVQDIGRHFDKKLKFDGITIMDRAGASTMAHTGSLMNDADNIKFSIPCKMLAKFATHTLVMQNLRVFRKDGIRFQKTPDEFVREESDIIGILDDWKIPFTYIGNEPVKNRTDTALAKILPSLKI